MKKATMAKAIRLADKTKARPEKVVITTPKPSLFVKKPAAQVLSERIHTRVTLREKKRLDARIGSRPVSELLRELLTQYLDKLDTHARRKAR